MKRHAMRVMVAGLLLWLFAHPPEAIAQGNADLEQLKDEIAELREDVDDGMDRLERSLQIHGFISQGFMRSTDNNYLTKSDRGSFEFNEVGINFMASLSDKLHVGVQLFSRDLGELGNNEVEVDWAFGDYHWSDWLGVRAGRVKLPAGQYNESRDVDALRTSILLPQAVYLETYRDMMLAMNGVLLYGEIPMDTLGSVGYQTWIGGMSMDSENSSVQQQAEDEMFIPGFGWVQLVDLDSSTSDYVTGLSMDWSTPFSGLRLTGSYVHIHDIVQKSHTLLPFGLFPAGTQVTTTGNFDFFTFGGEYSIGDLTIAGEYRKQDARFYQSPVPPSEISIHSGGWYVTADYQFTETLAVGTCYSEYYPDRHDKDGDNQVALGKDDSEGWQKDISLFCRYDLNDSFALKTGIHFIDGTGQLFDGKNQQGQEDDWVLWLVKFSYNF